MSNKTLTPYVRKSSYQTWDFCNHKWYLIYGLGINEPPNIKTIYGTVTHKVLDILAQCKLAFQNGQKDISDDLIGTVSASLLNLDSIISQVYKGYSAKYPELKNNDGLNIVKSNCWKAISDYNGSFNPLQRKIICAEKTFDIPLPFSWAKFEFDGQTHYFAMKGTIDLATDIGNGVLEIIDWKTGARKNWKTGKIKDVEYLRNDLEFKFYHYAATQLYSDYKTIVLTMYFINSGGPITIAYDQTNLVETENILKNHYFEITNTQYPRKSVGYWCKAFCYFGRNNYKDSNSTICNHIHKQIGDKGIDNTTKEYKIPNFDPFKYQAPGQ